MKPTTIKSIFGEIKQVGWLEYLAKIQYTNKENMPIKFQAILVWKSSYKFAAPSKISGSFSSKNEAFKFVEEAIEKIGGYVVDMNEKKIKFLSQEFNYPDRRSTYLSNPAILKEKCI